MNNYIRAIVFLFFYILKINSILPQNISQQFRHYTTKDGLPSSEVYEVIQDSKGYMWFATDRGVARFNGYEFHTFTTNDGLTDNTVFRLFEDYNGRIWMYSFSGKLFYYINGKIYPFKYNDSLSKINRDQVVWGFYVDSADNVFVALNGTGEFKIDSKGKVHSVCLFNSPNKKTCFIDESSPEKMIFSSNMNTYGFTPLTIIHKKRESTDTLIFESMPNGRFYSLSLNQNQLIFSCKNLLFEKVNGVSKLIQKFSTEIICIRKDRNDNVFIGTENGVYVLNQNNLTEYKAHYLTKKTIGGVLQDNEGGYWFITLEDGIYYLPGHEINIIKFNDERLKKPVSLTNDSASSVYAGFWSGALVRISNSSTKLVYYNGKLGGTQSIHNLSCFHSDDKIYLSQGSSSGYFTNGNYHPYKGFFKTNFLKREDGIIFCASGSFIYKIKNDSVKLISSSSPFINCLGKSNNRQLILGCNTGVYLFDELDYKIKNFQQGLSNIRIDDIKWFQNSVCFATKGKGILFLVNDTIYKIDESNGLCSNLTNKILVDGNNLWCATNKGISHIYFSDFNKFNYSITNIHELDGLLSDEINDLTLFKDTIYLATNSGISFFNKRKDFITHTSPPIHIVSLSINNADTLVKDSIEFTYPLNNIRFGIEGIGYRSDQKINYKYRLINKTDTISSFTTNRNVDFFSLSPGHYQFSVSAINNSGVWSSKPATFSFIINPPWWQSSWFRSIVLFSVITLVIVLYKNRIKRINERFTIERKQASLQLTAVRAQMNPHFIFNVMDSIRNYMMDNNTASAEKYLTSFAKLVRYTLDRSDKQICSLEEELNMIRIYIELEKERFSKQIDVEIVCDNSIDISDVSIPTMILQPFVENAFKHGLKSNDDVGKISIKILKHAERIDVIIEDNGRSSTINKENIPGQKKENKSYGTALVQERITAYNLAFGKHLSYKTENRLDADGQPCGMRVIIAL